MIAMSLARSASIESHPLERVELPSPRPGPHELVLRVTACGICRTDLQLCEGDLMARRLPIVPGHQIVGRVTATGDGVTDWREGDRAGVGWLAGACGTCSRCREGRENLCANARFTGWDRDGGYAEEVIVDAAFALRVPDAFTDLAVAPLLCGGVIGYRSLKVSGIRPGQRLGLYGFGASALMAIQIALHWDCRVFVCTRSEAERTRAISLGAAWAGGYDDVPPVKLDAAVTFAPAGNVVIAALKGLDRGGTVAINAIHLDQVPAFAYDDLWWEKGLRSVANFTREDAHEMLDLAARIPIKTSFDLFPLEDANIALERLKAGLVRGAAVLQTGLGPRRIEHARCMSAPRRSS